MKQYLELVKYVLDNGQRKENRTGIDTISTFNYNYEIDLAYGFPMLTTKEISWKNIVIELLWFLSGETDISILKHHGCKFWDAWADEEGKVPSAYGSFWRAFPTYAKDKGGSGPYFKHTDQVQWVLDELKHNPMSRRMVVSAWSPDNAQNSKLPPCHYTFAFNVQNEPVYWTTPASSQPRLNLHLTQRSCDVALGLPYNIASYSLLLSLFSQFSGIEVGKFAHSMIDAHIYTAKANGDKAEYDHVPGLQTQLKRETRRKPWLTLDKSLRDLQDVRALMDPKLTTEEVMSHFVLEDYNPHPAIRFKVAV